MNARYSPQVTRRDAIAYGRSSAWCLGLSLSNANGSPFGPGIAAPISTTPPGRAIHSTAGARASTAGARAADLSAAVFVAGAGGGGAGPHRGAGTQGCGFLG